MTAACAACGGVGWVRRDLPTWHPEFAAAVRCPVCGPVVAPVAAAAPIERPRLRIVS